MESVLPSRYGLAVTEATLFGAAGHAPRRLQSLLPVSQTPEVLLLPSGCVHVAQINRTGKLTGAGSEDQRFQGPVATKVRPFC